MTSPGAAAWRPAWFRTRLAAAPVRPGLALDPEQVKIYWPERTVVRASRATAASR